MQKTFVPVGSDVSSGSFKCVDCGHVISMPSAQSLPPCPRSQDRPHQENGWSVLAGQGDAPEDPYPKK